MSTPIKDLKGTLTVIKTLTNHLRSLKDSEISSELVFYKEIRNLLSNIYDGEIDLNSKDSIYELERSLFTQITDTNIHDHQEIYGNTDQAELNKHIVIRNKMISNIAKLDTLSLANNELSNGMLAGLYDDILHGLDSNTLLTDRLENFRQSISKFAVSTQPNFKDELGEIEEVATSISSMGAWGNNLLGVDRGFSMIVDKLNLPGSYENGDSKTLYGYDVLSSLLITHLNETEKFEDMYFDDLLSASACSNKPLPRMSKLTGLNINITGDIPYAEEKDLFVLAKVINDIADKFENPEWIKEQLSEDSERDTMINLISKKLNLSRRSINDMVVSNLKGFRAYYGHGLDGKNIEDLAI